MFDIHFNFNYSNVGQGLFHFGSINEFNYVYDCGGSNTYIQNALKEYYPSNKSKKINLLIISHFHDDHVNGLDYLFYRMKIEVDTVVLPYVTREERLFLSFKQGYTNIELLIDPVLYFLERNVKRVILIKGDEEGDYYDIDDLPSPNPNLENAQLEELNFSSMKRDKELEEQIKGEFSSKKNYGQLFVYHHCQLALLNDFWLFRFFNLRRNKREIQVFKDFLYKSKIILKKNNNIKEILRDERKRNIIKAGYDLLKGNFNNTSLCCLHSPLEFTNNVFFITKINRLDNSLYIGEEYFEKAEVDYPVGHMLTGDLSLNKISNYNEFKKHYKGFFDKIGIFLLPHHGASRNWNDKVFDNIKKLPIFWVASAGFSNKFSHPSIRIINEVIEREHYFIKSHEFVSISGSSVIRI